LKERTTMNRAQRRQAARNERRPQTPEPKPPHANLIVYGARCAWWDSIDKVATIPGSGLPCCPHCGSVLYQTSPRAWWAGVELHDGTHPGYRAMIEWARGRCFPDYAAMEVAYESREAV
jgi:hypothetical protein